jgi:hypothetical protein
VLNVSKRKLKSLKFRSRRRALNMEEYGLLFKPRDFQKNSNRQKAALNRKRDDLGKFLDGPRELKDSVVSTMN